MHESVYIETGKRHLVCLNLRIYNNFVWSAPIRRFPYSVIVKNGFLVGN